MTKPYKPVALTLIGLLVWGSAACSRSPESAGGSSGEVSNLPGAVQSAQTQSAQARSTQARSETVNPSQAQPTVDPFRQALERAASASSMSQSAQSRDDWRLVANRWQQAIQLIKTVPSTNPQHRQVQQKLAEYQRNLTYAQRQASRPTVASPDGVIVLKPEIPQPPPPPARPAAPPIAKSVAAPKAVAPAPAAPAAEPASRTFSVPIIRRAGNTPVVQVTFNGSQPFEMIVDTGASGTLITRQMATALNVVPVGEANVDTASQKDVTFPLGYVKSAEVGGVVANNLLVAIADNNLDIGLLGHDFFGNYDVTIRQNSVEFRER